MIRGLHATNKTSTCEKYNSTKYKDLLLIMNTFQIETYSSA